MKKKEEIVEEIEKDGKAKAEAAKCAAVKRVRPQSTQFMFLVDLAFKAKAEAAQEEKQKEKEQIEATPAITSEKIAVLL